MASTVKRVGNLEIEHDRMEQKVHVSHMNGEVLATFEQGSTLEMMEWMHNYTKGNRP